MARTGHKFTAQDSGGNIVSPAAVEVRRAADSTLATLYDAVTGGNALGNPFNTASDGSYEFFTEPDRYNVTVGSGPSAYTYSLDLVDGRSTLYFPNRSDFVSWVAAGGDIPDGALVPAGGLQYEADSTSTAISDLLGFKPFGDVHPDHFGENTTPGTTDMTAAVSSGLSAKSDSRYLVSSGQVHPDLRSALDVSIETSSSVSPAYLISSLNDVRLTGRFDLSGASAFGVLLREGVNGFVLQNIDMESEGFPIVCKPSEGTSQDITGATNANPAVFTVAGHGFTNGTTVKLSRMTGGTWDSVTGATYTVANATTDTFTLGVDGTSLGAFASGKATTAPLFAENGVIHGNNVRGGATTTDVGVSLDGDSRNVVVSGNVITNIQRSDSSRDAHAFAVAGGDGDDIAFAASENIMVLGNTLEDIAGNAFHTEDACPRVSYSFNVSYDTQKGIEIVNDDGPLLHNYIGNLIAGASEYFVDAVGNSGSTKDMNYAFNIFDGNGVSLTTSYAVRINQVDTKNINYIGNIHHDLTQQAFFSDAEGPFNFSYNVFEDITGDCSEWTRAAAVATVSYNIFDGGSDAIVGNGTGIFDPAALRGIWVESNNRYDGATNPVKKTASANIVGDQRAISPEMDSDIAETKVIFVAPRDGWITGVVRLTTSAGGAGTSNSTFTVYKHTAGSGSTKLIDNSIPRNGALWDRYLWTGQDTQVEVNEFSAGDVIYVECDGVEDASTKFQIQLDYFYT